MSERQEKKKRYNLRLMWIADFDKWLNREPPCGECLRGGGGNGSVLCGVEVDG